MRLHNEPSRPVYPATKCRTVVSLKREYVTHSVFALRDAVASGDVLRVGAAAYAAPPPLMPRAVRSMWSRVSVGLW